MVQGREFSESHSPTASHDSIRILVALAAALNMTLYGIDIENAFQNKPKEDSEDQPPMYVNMPPLYM